LSGDLERGKPGMLKNIEDRRALGVIRVKNKSNKIYLIIGHVISFEVRTKVNFPFREIVLPVRESR
jgi:hypothetical protein